MTKPEHKWVIEQDFPWVREEIVVLIPRIVESAGDFYFVRATGKAVSSICVFDTPQEAAIAVIARNNKTIGHLKVDNERLQEWHDKLEAAREAEAERLREER